jgi:hypothetical protein
LYLRSCSKITKLYSIGDPDPVGFRTFFPDPERSPPDPGPALIIDNWFIKSIFNSLRERTIVVFELLYDVNAIY